MALDSLYEYSWLYVYVNMEFHFQGNNLGDHIFVRELGLVEAIIDSDLYKVGLSKCLAWSHVVEAYDSVLKFQLACSLGCICVICNGQLILIQQIFYM